MVDVNIMFRGKRYTVPQAIWKDYSIFFNRLFFTPSIRILGVILAMVVAATAWLVASWPPCLPLMILYAFLLVVLWIPPVLNVFISRQAGRVLENHLEVWCRDDPKL